MTVNAAGSRHEIGLAAICGSLYHGLFGMMD